MTNPGKYFHNNVVQRPQAAQRRRRGEGQEIRLQLHLRHLRPARPRADDRGFAAAPHQSLRRIQADVREDAATGITRFTGWNSSPSAISTPPAPAKNSASITASRPISSPTSSRSRSARPTNARFTARIIPRPTAPASAITSTSWTSPRPTSWPSRPANRASTTSATATVTPSAQVIQTCEKVTGKKIPAVEKPRRPGDPPKLVASAEKAIRELGWKPKYPKLEDIVATAWNWHKKHPTGYPD